MNIIKVILLSAAALSLTLRAQQQDVNVTPHPIPGKVKADFNVPSAGYGSSTVQTQLRVDVKESDKAVRFVRTNTDPLVITRLYTLK
ncbi:MAG: hypothetical protein E7055_21550, partial [Lentisphaerae bacterium]|nr:hypothetical protein [Lentisphaerota bacterium]